VAAMDEVEPDISGQTPKIVDPFPEPRILRSSQLQSEEIGFPARELTSTDAQTVSGFG
jgi:hypothetical protein